MQRKIFSLARYVSDVSARTCISAAGLLNNSFYAHLDGRPVDEHGYVVDGAGCRIKVRPEWCRWEAT